MSEMAITSPAQKTTVEQYRRVRAFTDRIIEPLSPEDCMVQSMDDVSPTRWHIAHTTWFFETFVLKQFGEYQEYDSQFNFLFNSYYNAIGNQFSRPKRGLISRPGLQEIKQYRAHVDEQIVRLLDSSEFPSGLEHTIQVGLHHEQQHQELMLTDIKHVLSCNPTLPVYRAVDFEDAKPAVDQWIGVDEGIYSIGHQGDGFSFDNESPRQRVFLNEFRLAKCLVTCGQYLEFMEDGGYERPEFWLSLGWSTASQHSWNAPLYWIRQDDAWFQFTLAGLQKVHPDWPVCHVSYFEADAFARWAGQRLPTEFEWEATSQEVDPSGDLNLEPFADVLWAKKKAIHPTQSPDGLLGGLWQWTSSSYGAYPGYRVPEGALGEYNGKFMCNQYVLRGGSVATVSDHIRPTYRNFFPPDARWQFTGIRLAR